MADKPEPTATVDSHTSDTGAPQRPSANSSLASSASDLSEFDPLKPRSGSKVEVGKGDLDLSGTFGDRLSTTQSASSSVTSSPQRQSSRSPAKRKLRSVTNESVSTMDLGGKEDYIYLAANRICLAQDCEASGQYDMAFGHYKTGVGILLQGVQSELSTSFKLSFTLQQFCGRLYFQGWCTFHQSFFNLC